MVNEKEKKRRVVVTGLGVVSSIGIGWQEFWENLLKGMSGISEVSHVDNCDYDRKFAGEIRGFNAKKIISDRICSQLGKTSQFALSATILALKDAGIPKSSLKSFRTGIFIGTTMGEPQVQEDLNIKYFPHNKKRKVDLKTAYSYPANSISANIAKYLKINSYNYLFSTACASGNYSLGYAFDLIKQGKIDCAVVGGADALSRVAFTGFARVFAMSPDECRPFDKNRNGMQVGEGAAILILESLESAKRRKAHIYAEILGYGMSCDAKHMTNPSETGVAKAMQKALKNSGVGPDEVDYISAHGTGTVENDKAECAAIHRVFGKRAKTIPVSSIKSMLGHTMGAASAFESIACCLALKTGKVPPTINFKEKDPDCDINCVPNQSQDCSSMKFVLNNSQAFGGNNSCIALSI